MLEVSYSPEFKRAYKKLPRSVHALIKKKGVLFVSDPFHPSLRTHKLTGTLKGLWAFSVDHRNRVIFEFTKQNTALLHSVGDHSVYRKS